MAVQLENVVKKTQITLKQIFSKPKCSTKLLSKPPFRFIHDIITATMASTGFPKNYFTAQELASKNLKDKSSKIALLNKLIYLVNVCHGSEIDVRPSKIVAGLEAINTNILLTLFGEMALNANGSIDQSAAIKHCQFGGSVEDFVRTSRKMKEDGTQKRKDDDEKDVMVEDRNDEKKVNDTEEAELEARNHESVETKQQRKDQQVDNDAESALVADAKNDIFENQISSKDEAISKFGDEKEAVYDVGDSEASNSLYDIISKCNGDVATTKQMMANIITKPKCSEKLLKKPPFRFLHDVIIAVNEATGIGLETLLSANELDSSMVKTKDTKIKFLDKIIEFLNLRLNMTIDLKPSKVVAGLEPEKTCHFLQLFGAYALNHKMTASLKVLTKSESKESPVVPSSQNQENVLNNMKMNEMSKEIAESKSTRKDENAEVQPTGVDISMKDHEKGSDDPNRKVNLEESEPRDRLFSHEEKFDLMEKGVDQNEVTDSKKWFQDPKTCEEVESTDEKLELTGKSAELDESNNCLSHTETDCKNDCSSSVRPSSHVSEKKASHGAFEKESTNFVFGSKETSIQQAFFGEEEHPEDEDIIDEVKPDWRPKTARRRPPRIKDIQDSNDMRSRSFSAKKNVVFKEEINDFDHYLSTNKNETYSPKVSNTISYDFSEMCNCLQTIANSVSSIGRAMELMPSEMNKIRKERLHYNDEMARQTKELEKVKDITQIELRPIQAQVDALNNKIEETMELLHSKKGQFGENEDWISNQMKRICKV